MTQRPALLLASNSPRRRQLLALGDWTFRTTGADIDEQPVGRESASVYVTRLAQGKARAASTGAASHEVIVAADTTVADSGQILGKPRDAADATSMLQQLRGHAHQVYTAIAAIRVADGREVRDLCVTEVPMRDYSDAELVAYVDSGDPLDKAGAYSIQYAGFHPVDGLQGCYASVMGLPLCHLVRLLWEFEGRAVTDTPSRCQRTLAYDCPVSEPILRGGQVG